jgi:hypothetical protein
MLPYKVSSDALGYTPECAATLATLVESHNLTDVCLQQQSRKSICRRGWPKLSLRPGAATQAARGCASEGEAHSP